MALAVNFIGSAGVLAGTKDMVAGKKDKFKDDNVESMRDVFSRRESEEREYKQKLLKNSNETVRLLNEIRKLLVKLNNKK